MKIPSIDVLKKKSFDHVVSEDFKKSLISRKRLYRFFKRIFDVSFCLVAGVAALPFMIVIAAFIRLDSPGRAIFVQERVGLDGDIFRMYKFRTMFTGVKNQEFAPNIPNDPRITKAGRFLRKTSLDELPQLWNVLRGQMSLVGPRPEMKFIVDTYTDIESARLMVKPGLTGLWQIFGRKDLPLHLNVEFDLYYIENLSLWLDLQIIFKTFGVVLEGKGAY